MTTLLEAAEKVSCNPHPDAPHGFDRNASHNAGRYVCECESWEDPNPKQWQGLTEEEISASWGDPYSGNTEFVRNFARAIESKLKEKSK